MTPIPSNDRGLFGLVVTQLSAPFWLWRIEVPRLIDPVVLACLSAQERVRAARFASAPLARRYAVAHGALRLLGERCFGVPAAHQRYVHNAYGKPILANLPQARCSLSYSGTNVLAAWSLDHEIGVDLECARPIADAADLADLHCTVRERQRLPRPGAAGYDRAFLALWVRKEACVKALGRGLGIAPSSFECDIDPGKTIVHIHGSLVESHVCNLKDDLLVAWARCIRVNRSDRNHRPVFACFPTDGVAEALRE